MHIMYSTASCIDMYTNVWNLFLSGEFGYWIAGPKSISML